MFKDGDIVIDVTGRIIFGKDDWFVYHRPMTKREKNAPGDCWLNFKNTTLRINAYTADFWYRDGRHVLIELAR